MSDTLSCELQASLTTWDTLMSKMDEEAEEGEEEEK